MTSLLRIEWSKIRYYRAFWWVLGITAVTYPSVSYFMLMFYRKITEQLPPDTKRAFLGNPFGFNEVWHTVAYCSSMFIMIPAIVVIMLITNEYSFKTGRQNIIDGWSRQQFLTGKLMGVVIISLLVVLLYVATSLLIGFSNTNPGDVAGENKTYFIVYFLFQTFSQLSIAFLIGFLLRRSFIALAVFIFSFLVLEPLLTAMLSLAPVPIGHFLPFEISDRMIPPPGFMGKMDPAAYALTMKDTGYHFVYTIVFTALVWLLCIRLNSKRDL